MYAVSTHLLHIRNTNMRMRFMKITIARDVYRQSPCKQSNVEIYPSIDISIGLMRSQVVRSLSLNIYDEHGKAVRHLHREWHCDVARSER